MSDRLKIAVSFIPWFLFVAIYFYYPFSDEVAQYLAILPMACLAGWLQVVIYLKLWLKSARLTNVSRTD